VLFRSIVNYRTAELTLNCLRSLDREIRNLSACRVLVTDNASEDGSAERLAESIARHRWSEWVSVSSLARNGGFAFGNNAGIRAALATSDPVDYVMLLNPDTTVRPGAIRALVEFMETHPRAGIAGSRLENANGDAECSAHTVPSPLGELDAGARLGVLSRLLRRYVVSPPLRDEAHECDWVSGASLIVRRSVFETVGLMDEEYFLYFEEVDLCCRAKSAGWAVWYVPQSRVMHLEGAATGIRRLDERRPRYWYDSRRRFFVKRYGVGGLIFADLFFAFGRATLALRRLLGLRRRTHEADPKRFTIDLLWGDLLSLLTGEVWKVRGARGLS